MVGDSPAWKVAFTRRAETDILEIFTYIAERDGMSRNIGIFKHRL
jgi:plasmid stabilization system protein ParE